MTYQLKAKIWLEKNNRKVFGDGPLDILRRVNQTGSLRQAAAEINMSYSQAWHLIRMLEKNLGFVVLEKQAGGQGGGHSKLTSEADNLVTAYELFRNEANSKLEELFEKYLSGLNLKDVVDN